MTDDFTGAVSPQWRLARPTFPFGIVVIAASLGGLRALGQILAAMPQDFPAPIVVVQHLSPRFPSGYAGLLDRHSPLMVTWAQSGQQLRTGVAYIAPPDYHLRISRQRMFRLSQDPYVQFVRPSADVLFTSAADVYGGRCLAVVLMGGQRDGAQGVQAIKRHGGVVVAQDQPTSAAFGMPSAAIATGCVDFVLPLRTIAPALVALTMVPGAAAFFRVHSSVA